MQYGRRLFHVSNVKDNRVIPSADPKFNVPSKNCCGAASARAVPILVNAMLNTPHLLYTAAHCCQGRGNVTFRRDKTSSSLFLSLARHRPIVHIILNESLLDDEAHVKLLSLKGLLEQALLAAPAPQVNRSGGPISCTTGT